MKKVKFLLLFVVIICLSGCVSINSSITINEDKSGAFDFTYLVEDEELSFLDSSMIATLQKNGFIIVPLQFNTKSGYSIIYKFDNIDDISSKEANFDLNKAGKEIMPLFTKKAGLFRDKYTLNLIIDEDSEIIKEYQQMASSVETEGDFDVNFYAKLPFSSIDSNATGAHLDGLELDWKSADYSEGMLYYYLTFAFYKWTNIIISCVVGGALIISIVIITIVSNKKKKIKLHKKRLTKESKINMLTSK